MNIITVTEEKEKVVSGADSIYLPEEKEAYIHIDGMDRSRMHITSRIEPMIKHLLQCDDLEVTSKHTNEAGEICQLEGYLPVTYLRFKTEPRKDNYFSRIFEK